MPVGTKLLIHELGFCFLVATGTVIMLCLALSYSSIELN